MRVLVKGFVTNMPELMTASDVIVTKAGPGTISEALICGLPMVLNAFVPCQEEGNIPYVTQNGVRGKLMFGDRSLAHCGGCQLLLATPHACCRCLRRWASLSGTPKRWRRSSRAGWRGGGRSWRRWRSAAARWPTPTRCLTS